MGLPLLVRLALLAAGLALSGGAALAAPPDFNADRRVNLKCPVSIDRDFEGQFAPDGFLPTVRRLFHDLDQNLKAAARPAGEGHGAGYAFSANPNEGIFFVCHAKATFPAGGLPSLLPAVDIAFQEVFYVTAVDWDARRITLLRQRDRRPLQVDLPDFERGFIWYNALLDNQRAFIPVYGFLSLPADADDFPTIYDGWQAHRSDTATPPESLVDYDFYKILDYRDGFYLLAQDVNELDYRSNIEDFGIIGWVPERYITLWRSRLYYHPVAPARFYTERGAAAPAVETEEINRFYVRHAYLEVPLFRDIVEKIDQDSLHRFYAHFGFPRLGYPQIGPSADEAKVFIPGAFTPRLMRLLGRSLKRNLNVFFLFDASQSMQPFADYVKSFNQVVQGMAGQGLGLRANRLFAYWDTPASAEDAGAAASVMRVRRPEDLVFGRESGDRNYAEPLLRALEAVLDQVEALQREGAILPLQPKLLFVLTDAGANDLTDARLAAVRRRMAELNLNVYFVYPDRHGVRRAAANMHDSPEAAYGRLGDLMARFAEGGAAEQVQVRAFRFASRQIADADRRREDFARQQLALLSSIREYIDAVFSAQGPEPLPRDVVLYFSDDRLISAMRRWSDRKIQVLNHVVRFIRGTGDPSRWEARIAIPAKPVEAFLRAVRTQDDVSLADLKKLVIINSLVSVDDVVESRRLYDAIQPLIEKKTFRSADAVFYTALTGREPGNDTGWNRRLAEDRALLDGYLAARGFHLNSFNQAVQRKFMFLTEGELYQDGR